MVNWIEAEERESLQDDPKSGCPATATTEENQLANGISISLLRVLGIFYTMNLAWIKFLLDGWRFRTLDQMRI